METQKLVDLETSRTMKISRDLARKSTEAVMPRSTSEPPKADDKGQCTDGVCLVVWKPRRPAA